MSDLPARRVASRRVERIGFRAGKPDDLATVCDIDTDACTLYERAGLHLELEEGHEFSSAERRRWRACLEAGTTIVAIDSAQIAVGFAAVGQHDGEPYLDQLSVRLHFMGLGIGGALLSAACETARASGGAAMWLTTYDHLAWNRPFYERHGFQVVSEQACGPELRRGIEFERRWLPMPDERVVMHRKLSVHPTR